MDLLRLEQKDEEPKNLLANLSFAPNNEQFVDRFELPHYSTCREQGESPKDAISVWIDSNHHIASKAM